MGATVITESSSVGAGPAWWQEIRKTAWDRYSSLPMPHRKMENWRFSDLGKIKIEGFKHLLPVSPEHRQQLVGKVKANRPNVERPRLVFANDQLIDSSPLPESFKSQGVLRLTLEEALQSHGDLIKRHFLAHPSALGSDKFSALHAAHAVAGTVIYVPKNVEVSIPLETWNWITDAQAAVFPHTLIIAEANSKVEVVDYFESLDRAAAGFACGAVDLFAGPGSNVRYVAVQRWGAAVSSLQLQSVSVDRDANSTTLNLNVGGAYSRLESRSRLMGTGSKSDMLSLSVGHGKQEFDQRTFQEHMVSHTSSDLLYKNALNDTSRSIFAGMIAVDPNAQQTDAYQSNRNLLLSTEAEANSLPGLEIMANDVRCTHGSTSGQINPEEMFYMRQRGIPPNVARKLMVIGFACDVLDRLKDEALSKELIAITEDSFPEL